MDTMDSFGKKVKHRLVDIGKRQQWLIDEVKEKTGMYCDSSLLNKIYNGEVATGKIKEAICEILEIKEE